jgi:hypothetical protein
MLYRLAIVAAGLLLIAAVARAGVTATADGWTDITPSADSRIVCVAAGGLDTNLGTQAAPLKTIAAAVSKMRAGYPDQVLLKRGDTFAEAVVWKTGGRSDDEPQLLGAWGVGARPIISPPSGGNGFESSNVRRAFLAIVGVSFQATRDAANLGPVGRGLRWFGPGDGLLIEDVEIRGFATGFTLEGAAINAPISNVRINRCAVFDNFQISGGRAQGCYMTWASNVRLTECLFDRNGWSPTAPGAGANVYDHNIYIDNEQATADGLPGPGVGFVVERCILTRTSSHGLQLRCGGTVNDNLFAENAIALLIGGGDGYATSSPGGIAFAASNNVIIHGVDIDAANPRGFGVDLVNIKAGTITGNIVAHDKSAAAYGHGVSISAPTTGLSLAGNIVYDWHTPKLIGAGASITEPTPGNVWLGFGAANPGYIAPMRDVASYHATIGGVASLDAFLARARTQSRATWDARYTASAVNAYIRAGFVLGTPTPPPAPVLPTFDLTVSVTPTGGTFRAVDASGKTIDGTVGKIDLTLKR